LEATQTKVRTLLEITKANPLTKIEIIKMTDMPQPQPQPQPQPATPTAAQEVFATFVGGVDQAGAQRLMQGFSGAMAQGVRKVHLLFQSTGGTVADGVVLYNYFRALPIGLCLYNAGSVASIAVIAFLGSKERKTSAFATFMIHRSQMSPQFATAERLHALAYSLTLDDQRTEAILRQHIKMPDDRWSVHKTADLWFDAKEAIKFGIATSEGEFSPPIGTQIFNV
jgi:ATP-dependent Clp protease protease subunit